MAEPRWLDDRQSRAWLGYRRMRLLLDAQISHDVLSALTARQDRRWRLQELADRMLWSKSRLSRHISRMEERGLVSREECATDGRGAVIVLSEGGWRAIQEAAPPHVESVRRHLIDLLTDEQLDALGDISDIVLSNLASDDA
jgi:DNA-binding MarR family transcriptional regulator